MGGVSRKLSDPGFLFGVYLVSETVFSRHSDPHGQIVEESQHDPRAADLPRHRTELLRCVALRCA